MLPVREGHRFPMEKYELIPLQLLYEGLAAADDFFQPTAAAFETCCLAHDPAFVTSLFDLTLDPKMVRRVGFPLTQQLIQRERLLVDGTIQAAQYALKYGVAFNVAGGTHHAGYDYAEGFCLLNDQAIAARYLLRENRAKQVLMIDLDAHQGNGTAHIFADDQRVYTFSMHAEKNFPFIKEKSDLDIALADAVADQAYLETLERELKFLFEQVKPDFVFYQAGVDVLKTDKLGKLHLSPAACKQRDRLVFSYCRQYAVPVQVSMGGGYAVHIKDIVNAHCETFKAAIDLYNF